MRRSRWPHLSNRPQPEATESALADRQVKLRALDKLILLIDTGVTDRNDLTASGERDPKEGMEILRLLTFSFAIPRRQKRLHR
jgi:hypothetical protein